MLSPNYGPTETEGAILFMKYTEIKRIQFLWLVIVVIECIMVWQISSALPHYRFGFLLLWRLHAMEKLSTLLAFVRVIYRFIQNPQGVMS